MARNFLHLKSLTEFTSKEPYGILLNYKWQASQKEYKKTTAYYATYFLTLIRNADFITFKFFNQEYTVTKADLIKWYEEDFTSIKSEEKLNDFLKYNFDADKVNELFL